MKITTRGEIIDWTPGDVQIVTSGQHLCTENSEKISVQREGEKHVVVPEIGEVSDDETINIFLTVPVYGNLVPCAMQDPRHYADRRIPKDACTHEILAPASDEARKERLIT
jgi:hypothetical protein